MCACGQNAQMQTLTTNQVNELLAAAQQQARLNEQEAMVASASNAVGNANSGVTAQR
jgi:hypothetical protein